MQNLSLYHSYLLCNDGHHRIYSLVIFQCTFSRRFFYQTIWLISIVPCDCGLPIILISVYFVSCVSLYRMHFFLLLKVKGIFVIFFHVNHTFQDYFNIFFFNWVTPVGFWIRVDNLESTIRYFYNWKFTPLLKSYQWICIY